MKTSLSSTMLPLVILEWRSRWYRHTPIAELRNFLEPRLAERTMDESLARSWEYSARVWSRSFPQAELRAQLVEYGLNLKEIKELLDARTSVPLLRQIQIAAR